jgi:hypothetical protein
MYIFVCVVQDEARERDRAHGSSAFELGPLGFQGGTRLGNGRGRVCFLMFWIVHTLVL